MAARHTNDRSVRTREQAIRWTPDEEKELRSRTWQWMYYLIRSPLWEQRTKPTVDAVLSRLQQVWGLGWMAAAFDQLIAYQQQYFTLTNPS